MSRLIVFSREVSVSFRTNLDFFRKLTTVPRKFPPQQMILHHDACLSALHCFKALQAQQLATHFCVDNDGTVWQFADPAADITWHARGQYNMHNRVIKAGFNSYSIGIDISNAVLTSFASRYIPPRTIGVRTIHGREISGLLPYPWQIDVTIDLVRLLAQQFDIPLVTESRLIHTGEIYPSTPGVFGHLHINPSKIDPFGFPFEEIAKIGKEGS
ncbi:MAG: peptidoglycan recognition family protein [Candidatus Hadarchaeum sp.]